MPSDALFVLRAPGEEMKLFNARLLEACKATPVTSAKLQVIDGQPAVVLFSEILEASEDDVADGLATEEGKPFLEQGPFFVKVFQVGSKTTEQRDHTENHFRKIVDQSEGMMHDVQFAHGDFREWVKTSDGLSQEYVPCTKTYGIAIWEVSEEDLDEVDDDEDSDAVVAADKGDDTEDAGDDGEAEEPAAPESQTKPAPKRRGRPPKVQPQASEGDE